ncbi:MULTISPECIES: sensor histidine kinase [unclassified Diaminobutyricimonas]|uniref:sensor histidine kinase n=1 Tax=unclassified Diaminobutyricimonas TaxID=2643261 RepID=UPI00141F45AB|nr:MULTISPECIES: sensor histidine kinase [unclassified Diaminobutyricimonas]
MTGHPRKRTAARPVAVVVLTLALCLGIAAVACDVIIARLGEEAAVAPGWTGGLPGIALATTGAILLWRLPWHPIACILLFFGAAQTFFGFCAGWVNIAAIAWREAPLVDVAFLTVQQVSGLTLLAIPLVLVIFPDGRLPRRPLLRGIGVLAIALSVPPMVVLQVSPPLESWKTFGNPDWRVLRWAQYDWGIPLPDGVWPTIARVAVACMLTGVALAAVVLAGRFVGAHREERQQLRWMVWGGALFSSGVVIGYLLLPYYIGQGLIVFGTFVTCWAILVAVTRYRLYSIDRLISWTFVYVILIVSVIAVDLALVALIGQLVGEQMLAAASMVVVFAVYAPIRERLLGWVSRVVNGRRADPYGVMSSLSHRLEDAVDPDDQLMHIARSLARTFASPFVRVTIEQTDGRRLVATHGEPVGSAAVMPLTYRGEVIGRLELAEGRRPRMSERDERLLADLVRQAAAAVRATVLSQELQAIREQLVRAREAERLRLRRDLHDGLGPALAAVSLRLQAAQNVLDSDPSSARTLLDSAAADVSDAVADIRRLTHDLRPPALDDVGLVRAAVQQCERFGAVLEVDGVPEVLPPAVEVAAYRVLSEALTNVSRHASASHITVALRGEPGRLLVEVADDGRGIGEAAVMGVGLKSMHERAEELGGTLTVTARPAGGTLVRAWLPMAEERACV